MKGRTVAEAMKLIADAIRYTFQYHEADYANHVLDDIALMQERNSDLVRLRNFWRETNTRESAACGITEMSASSSRRSSTRRSATTR